MNDKFPFTKISTFYSVFENIRVRSTFLFIRRWDGRRNSSFSNKNIQKRVRVVGASKRSSGEKFLLKIVDNFIFKEETIYTHTNLEALWIRAIFPEQILFKFCSCG